MKLTKGQSIEAKEYGRGQYWDSCQVTVIFDSWVYDSLQDFAYAKAEDGKTHLVSYDEEGKIWFYIFESIFEQMSFGGQWQVEFNDGPIMVNVQEVNYEDDEPTIIAIGDDGQKYIVLVEVFQLPTAIIE